MHLDNIRDRTLRGNRQLLPHGRIVFWIPGSQGRSCLTEARRYNICFYSGNPPAFWENWLVNWFWNRCKE